jgi:hypothetical protein
MCHPHGFRSLNHDSEAVGREYRHRQIWLGSPNCIRRSSLTRLVYPDDLVTVDLMDGRPMFRNAKRLTE